jgi:hypothetical protein
MSPHSSRCCTGTGGDPAAVRTFVFKMRGVLGHGAGSALVKFSRDRG